MAHHPSVLILFLGGTTLDERPRRDASVLQERNIDGWLAQMGEMDVIASTAGVFIDAGVTAVGLPEWAAAAKLINQRYDDFDGFVVVHQLATMANAAVALSLMLERLGKPVILAGSPLLSAAEKSGGWAAAAATKTNRLGVKANFINAIQVAVSDLAEVVVVIGHQLYLGRAFMGSPINFPNGLIGKIDFGVRLFGRYQTRRPGRLKLKQNFATRVAIFDYTPGLDIQYLVRQIADSRGVFLTGPDNLIVPVAAMANLAKIIPSTKPIILHGRAAGRLPANVITVEGDRNNRLIQFLWALGQSHQISVIRRLMSSSNALH